MADFLQRLLSDGGDGLLNASALSNSGVMEMLHRSLEESRRMSQSLVILDRTNGAVDPNETQASFLGGGTAAAHTALDQWPELQGCT